MKTIRLIMVTENNNNKFYNMTQLNSNEFVVEYGRVNSSIQKKTYPMTKWNSLYNQKIKKGYKDITALHKEGSTKSIIEKSKSPFFDIINRIHQFANQAVNDNYQTIDVTQKMIDVAQQKINELVTLNKQKNADAFNQKLLEIFAVIPRKMKRVNDHLYETGKNTMQNIIMHEQDILDALAAKVATQLPENATSFDDFMKNIGITMKEKDSKLEATVKDMLGEIKDKYVNCWYVNNEQTQNVYNDNLNNQIGVHKTEQFFWHGSRNENWLGILKSGLKIRPSCAVYTGSMFGDALYFANKARKSFGYTSARGSYWASGSSNTAIMAIFKVNTGKHHNVYKHTSECYDFNKKYLKSKGNYDSVYAHAGQSLKNDEFMVYDSCQATIYAIVELKA